MNTRNALLSLLLLSLTSIVGGCAADATSSDIYGAESAVVGRPYFQVFEGNDGDYRFRLKAANHQIVLASQAYGTRTAALNGVLSVMDNGELTGRYELLEASNGQHYFTLKSANGRVIGSSEMYSTRSNARAGIDTVVRNVGEYLDFLADRTGARFDVFEGADGRHYFNLHAKNGEITLSSQGYRTEESALNGTFSVVDNGLVPEQYDMRESTDGGFYFNLKSANGRTIATSEVYASRSNAERAVDSIMILLAEVELL